MSSVNKEAYEDYASGPGDNELAINPQRMSSYGLANDMIN